MVINILHTEQVKINYDTINELYVVIEADGNTNCSTAEVLLQLYKVDGDVNNHLVREFTVNDMIKVAVTTKITTHNQAVLMTRKYPLVPH